LQEISTIFKRKKLPSSARATGHVKLEGRAREAGIRCLKLTNKMTIMGLSPLPASFLLDKALVQASGQWLLPLNLRLPPAKMQMRLVVDIKARVPAQGRRPAMRIKMRIERTVTGRIRRLGPNP
jgi:hypothetical protein